LQITQQEIALLPVAVCSELRNMAAIFTKRTIVTVTRPILCHFNNRSRYGRSDIKYIFVYILDSLRQ